MQTAAKEEQQQQQQQQRFPSALILKLRVPSGITYSLCRIHGALDDRRLQKETEIIEKMAMDSEPAGREREREKVIFRNGRALVKTQHGSHTQTITGKVHFLRDPDGETTLDGAAGFLL